MARKKSVSVRSISALCNVSTATVSRVLNGDAHVSEATKSLVLSTAKSLGYTLKKPSNFSSEGSSTLTHNLVRAVQHRKIGIITRSISQDYYITLTQCITEYLEQFDIKVITASINKKDDNLPDVLQSLYESQVEGIILISCDYHTIKHVMSPAVSHVWIDCNDAPEQCREICTVQSDQFAGGQLAALELIAKGCKKPILLTSSSDSIRSQDRCRGFFQEFKKAQILLDEKERIYYLPLVKNVFEEAREMIRYLITKDYPFDSVFAISDWRALGVYAAVEGMNKKVPDDIRIVGFDGISLACRSVLRITSIQQNTRLLAQSACDLILSLLQGETVSAQHITIPVDLMEGQTT